MSAEPVPLFVRVLGERAWARLSDPVRALHAGQATQLHRGEVEVERGQGLLSTLMAACTSLPPAGVGGISVRIDADAGRETWTRVFGGRRMRSRLWARGGDGLLREHLGPMVFAFGLTVEDGAILWRIERAWLFGCVPLPRRWFVAVRCREYADGDHYRFDVRAALPGIGLLVHYRGWLAAT